MNLNTCSAYFSTWTWTFVQSLFSSPPVVGHRGCLMHGAKMWFIQTRIVLEEREVQLEKHKTDSVLSPFISSSILICNLEPSENKGNSIRWWNLTSWNLTFPWFWSLFLVPSWEAAGLDRITYTCFRKHEKKPLPNYLTSKCVLKNLSYGWHAARCHKNN